MDWTLFLPRPPINGHEAVVKLLSERPDLEAEARDGARTYCR